MPADALLNLARQAACAFDLPGTVQDVRPYGGGLINATYLLTLDSPPNKLILQRINSYVFSNPGAIMSNLRQLLKIAEADCGLKFPGIYRTKNGKDYHIDASGECWRVLDFIHNAHGIARLKDADQAMQVGLGLGRFHSLTQSLNPSCLAVTRPNFHDTPFYLKRFLSAWESTNPKHSPELRFCREFIAKRSAEVDVLERARKAGGLTEGVIHGDPKLDNFLFSDRNGAVVSLIDLDTVQPGLLLYDLGDCLRSICNIGGETPRDFSEIHFDVDLCRGFLAGYMQAAAGCLSTMDMKLLAAAIRLIPFELGLRFLTDYLAGNVYFRTEFPEHNLFRAMAQFYLVASIERQESFIRAAIQGN